MVGRFSDENPQDDALEPTVTNVIETLGLTTHHTWISIVVTFCFIFAGWGCTGLLFCLDAAGEEDSDWVRTTSRADMLTLENKSWLIFVIGLVGMIASSVQNTVSDSIGRIPVMQLCTFFGAVGAVLTGFAVSKVMLYICVMLNPFIRDGLCVTSSSLLAEWLPLKWRSTFILIMHVFWNFGRFLITLLWVLIPPVQSWSLFFGAASVLPVGLAAYLIVRGWRYESPRWLGSNGRMDKCIVMLQFLLDSEADQKRLPDGWDDPKRLSVDSTSGGMVRAEERGMTLNIKELCGPALRSRVVTLGLIHSSLSFASGALFMWLIEYLKMVGLDNAVQPAMIAAPVGKVCCNLALVVGGPGRCLIDTVPRVRIVQIGALGMGVTILLLIFSTHVWVVTAVVFLANFLEEMVWSIHLYTIEAFPTTVRNTGFGAMCIFGSAGAIASQSACGLMLAWWVYLPMVVMFVCCVIGAVLACFLPEDVCHHTLADTLSDASGSLSDGSYGTVDDPKAKLRQRV